MATHKVVYDFVTSTCQVCGRKCYKRYGQYWHSPIKKEPKAEK